MSADSEHKRNNASGASRWMACPGSIQLCETLPPSPENEAMSMGTKAHLLLEDLYKKGMSAIDFNEYPDDMVDNVLWAFGVIQSLRQQAVDAGDPPFMVSEFRADLAHLGMPDCGGTTDFMMLFPRAKELHIFDYKNGHVYVPVEENAQMQIYALCNTPEAHGVNTVHLHILQPNISRTDRVWPITVQQLNEWCEKKLKPAYYASFHPSAPLVPFASRQCRFCRARGACVACHNDVLRTDFPLVAQGKMGSVLSPDQIGKLLVLEEEVFSPYFAGLRNFAFAVLQRGGEVPYFKLVKGRKNRVFRDGAEKELHDSVPHDVLYLKPKMKSPAQLEKSKAYADLVKRLAYAPDGEDKMVRDTDPRATLSRTALQDFADEIIDVEVVHGTEQ